MSYFHTCPNCSANLVPGEICDCVDALVGALLILAKGAAEHWGDKKELPGAANTEQLKAEQVFADTDSASTISEKWRQSKYE